MFCVDHHVKVDKDRLISLLFFISFFPGSFNSCGFPWQLPFLLLLLSVWDCLGAGVRGSEGGEEKKLGDFFHSALAFSASKPEGFPEVFFFFSPSMCYKACVGSLAVWSWGLGLCEKSSKHAFLGGHFSPAAQAYFLCVLSDSTGICLGLVVVLSGWGGYRFTPNSRIQNALGLGV